MGLRSIPRERPSKDLLLLLFSLRLLALAAAPYSLFFLLVVHLTLYLPFCSPTFFAFSLFSDYPLSHTLTLSLPTLTPTNMDKL